MKSAKCKARQHSDQMMCECGRSWDVNDPEPPECPGTAAARENLEKIREVIKPALHGKTLPSLKEMPLKWLPTFGLVHTLLKVDWHSFPAAAFVVVSRPEGVFPGQGRDYLFYDSKGSPLMDLQLRDDLADRSANLRHWDAGVPGEWHSA